MNYRAWLALASFLVPLVAPAADSLKPLRDALTLHAPFDGQLDAAFSRGDAKIHVAGATPKGQPEVKVADVIKIDPRAGRFGGALHVTKKNPFRPYFNGPGVLGYRKENWSGSVSIWLRLTPDEDLEPGYCDPVQIVGGDNKKGFMFLEWSKDESPREFRYAIRPLVEIWNPQNKDWAKMSDAERPMVKVVPGPFARTTWTHVVFTFDRLNAGKSGVGTLYLDGKPQGTIKNWDLTLGWEAEKVQLVLAAAYVGHMDDLAVFNRTLTAAEVQSIFGLKGGIADLR
ncbi:MAG TPA: LamG-like jellyroll fold domain-containing protein [Opitutaceae bacterium]|nr:LamG-like jellyroll fold domain-containing protein [Opitutaceae bacterium]